MPALPTERTRTLAKLPPLSSSGTRVSPYFLATSPRILAAVNIGVNSAAGTIRLLRADNAAGDNPENASATTAFGGSSTTGDNVLHKFNLDPSVYATDAKPYLAVQIAAGGTYLSSADVVEFDGRNQPDDEAAGVTVNAAPAVA